MDDRGNAVCLSPTSVAGVEALTITSKVEDGSGIQTLAADATMTENLKHVWHGSDALIHDQSADILDGDDGSHLVGGPKFGSGSREEEEEEDPDPDPDPDPGNVTRDKVIQPAASSEAELLLMLISHQDGPGAKEGGTTRSWEDAAQRVVDTGGWPLEDDVDQTDPAVAKAKISQEKQQKRLEQGKRVKQQPGDKSSSRSRSRSVGAAAARTPPKSPTQTSLSLGGHQNLGSRKASNGGGGGGSRTSPLLPDDVGGGASRARVPLSISTAGSNTGSAAPTSPRGGMGPGVRRGLVIETVTRIGGGGGPFSPTTTGASFDGGGAVRGLARMSTEYHGSGVSSSAGVKRVPPNNASVRRGLSTAGSISSSRVRSEDTSSSSSSSMASTSTSGSAAAGLPPRVRSHSNLNLRNMPHLSGCGGLGGSCSSLDGGSPGIATGNNDSRSRSSSSGNNNSSRSRNSSGNNNSRSRSKTGLGNSPIRPLEKRKTPGPSSPPPALNLNQQQDKLKESSPPTSPTSAPIARSAFSSVPSAPKTIPPTTPPPPPSSLASPSSLSSSTPPPLFSLGPPPAHKLRPSSSAPVKTATANSKLAAVAAASPPPNPPAPSRPPRPSPPQLPRSPRSRTSPPAPQPSQSLKAQSPPLFTQLPPSSSLVLPSSKAPGRTMVRLSSSPPPLSAAPSVLSVLTVEEVEEDGAALELSG